MKRLLSAWDDLCDFVAAMVLLGVAMTFLALLVTGQRGWRALLHVLWVFPLSTALAVRNWFRHGEPNLQDGSPTPNGSKEHP